MAKILAPSNIGYKVQSYNFDSYWAPKPWPPSIKVSSNPTILRSYKSPTQKSDFSAPTNYCRMIAKIVPGGSVDCWNNTYSLKSNTAAGHLNDFPHGSEISGGKVGCPAWMIDKVILDAKADMQMLDANILEDLGQLRETGVMIAKLCNTVINLFAMAKAGSWGHMRRLLSYKYGVNLPRSVARGWLVYFYGIKPLISTIEALIEGQEPMYKTFSVRKRVSQNVSALPYFNGNYWHVCSGSAKIQAQCELTARIKLSGNLSSWQNLGLTSSSLTDAVVTAYALVPYSFVFDWLIPIESWLRTLVWSPFLEYQGGYTGKRHYANVQVKDLWPWSGNWPYSGQLPSFALAVRFYQRTTYPFTVPGVTLGIRLSLSPTQILSASALLTAIPNMRASRRPRRT